MRTRWMMMVLISINGLAHATFVTISNPGNAADANGYGKVDYTYRISATEVTIAEFQRATGAGNGNENYWNAGGRTVGTNAPASFVSINEAARYCNWLTSGNVNTGAYQFVNGALSALMTRAQILANGGLFYVLPTRAEWLKAAYYTGNNADLWSLYANGTDTIPTHGTAEGWNYINGSYVNGSPNYTWIAGYGGKEQNGTYDMMGNVWEWTEDFRWNSVSESPVYGGAYNSSSPSWLTGDNVWVDGAKEIDYIGFRVVAISDPARLDSDADGIPDWWELQYFRGTTNANPNAVCSNGFNTVREAYIAGINPTNSQSRLLISDFRSLTDGKAFDWNAVSGRVYSVYWSTNLLTGFQCLESGIPWTRDSFTNSTANPQGFYKITVRLAD